MRLLIIGSLCGELSTATKIAMANGVSVTHTADVTGALDQLRAGRGADLVMAEIGLNIAELCQSLQSERFQLPVIACGMDLDPTEPVKAIRAGAREYIPLPPDPELIAAVLSAVARDHSDIVYRDGAMSELMALVDQIAPSDASILITGESGTGKEVVARQIHRRSKRANHPLISVNCAAIPENLLESELFGHEKGAFTGAIARRVGKFEEAEGGTLLLDEISEMDVRLQAKLLRAIQERVIDRVGGSRPVPVNIRILATSNRDLTACVKEGRFREDLFYRLNVVNLRLPPLRDRRGDILDLCQHFIAHYSNANGMKALPLSEKGRQLLLANEWPGNVRELENTIHRAVLLAGGEEIDVDALRSPEGAPLSPSDPAEYAVQAAETVTRNLVGFTVAEMEQKLIADTLDHCLGNRTHAARILGISIRTLRNKLRQYSKEGFSIAGPGDDGIEAGNSC